MRLLEDPDLVERLTGNARAAIEHYEANRIRHEWVSLYHEIVAGRRRLAVEPSQ